MQREGAHRGVGGGGNCAKRRCTSRCCWWRELGKEKVHIEVLVVEGTRKEKVHIEVLVVEGTAQREGAYRGVGDGGN